MSGEGASLPVHPPSECPYRRTSSFLQLSSRHPMKRPGQDQWSRRARRALSRSSIPGHLVRFVAELRECGDLRKTRSARSLGEAAPRSARVRELRGCRASRFRYRNPRAASSLGQVFGVVIEPSNGDLRRLSQVRMANPSHHGITYLQPSGSPDDWVDQQFAAHLNEYHGFDTPLPEWGNSTAISAARATRPVMVEAHPSARPGSTLGITRGLLSGQAIAALPDLTGWVNPETYRTVAFGTDPARRSNSDFERARSIDLEFRRNVRQAQPNAVESGTGLPAGKQSSGILAPAPTVVTSVQLIGREARRWRDGRGTFEPPEIVTYKVKTDPNGLVALLREHFNWRGAAPVIAEATGLPERTVREILAGRRSPARQSLMALHEFAVQQRLDWPS
jgi:hypothetical protein